MCQPYKGPTVRLYPQSHSLFQGPASRKLRKRFGSTKPLVIIFTLHKAVYRHETLREGNFVHMKSMRKKTAP